MSFKGHVHNGTLGQALVAFWSAHVWKKNDYANMQIQKGDWGGGKNKTTSKERSPGRGHPGAKKHCMQAMVWPG